MGKFAETFEEVNTFHHRWIRFILNLGISNRQQWSAWISMVSMWQKWGDKLRAENEIRKRRLKWLGHLACMPDHRLPKSVPFAWSSQSHPSCGQEGCNQEGVEEC